MHGAGEFSVGECAKINTRRLHSPNTISRRPQNVPEETAAESGVCFDTGTAQTVSAPLLMALFESAPINGHDL